jgi:hypothetical protein
LESLLTSWYYTSCIVPACWESLLASGYYTSLVCFMEYIPM